MHAARRPPRCWSAGIFGLPDPPPFASRNREQEPTHSLATDSLRGGSPLVPVVEATNSTMGVDDAGTCRAARFHGTSHRRVLLDPEMGPIPVVVDRMRRPSFPGTGR